MAIVTNKNDLSKKEQHKIVSKMRNIILIGFFLLALLTNGVSAEHFSASFVETCIGCIDDAAPRADPVIGTMNLPSGRIEMSIDSIVVPYHGMGSITCISNFWFSDLAADLVAWPNSRTTLIQGKIIESTISPCDEDHTYRQHYVTQLVLKKPSKFDVVIVPSIEYHGSGPQWQYGQSMDIDVTYRELGLCPIIGTYTWFNGRTVYIRPDNTIEVWSGNTKEMRGTWAKSGGVYLLNWINDVTGATYVDTLTTSDDCQSVQGTNSEGLGISGTKISDTAGSTAINVTDPAPTPTPAQTPTPTTTPTHIATPTPTPTSTSTPVPTKHTTPTPKQTPMNIPCTNYWGPIEPLHIAEAGPRQLPGTQALFYTEIPRSSVSPRDWIWKLYGNVILKGGNKYFIIFGGSDKPQWFEDTNLPIDETYVTTTKDSAIIWYKNDDTEDMRYAYCFKPIGTPVVTNAPNVGIVATVSMIFLVYVLIRKR